MTTEAEDEAAYAAQRRAFSDLRKQLAGDLTLRPEIEALAARLFVEKWNGHGYDERHVQGAVADAFGAAEIFLTVRGLWRAQT